MPHGVPSVRFSLAIYKAILFFHIPVLFSLRRADLYVSFLLHDTFNSLTV